MLESKQFILTIMNDDVKIDSFELPKPIRINLPEIFRNYDPGINFSDQDRLDIAYDEWRQSISNAFIKTKLNLLLP